VPPAVVALKVEATCSTRQGAVPLAMGWRSATSSRSCGFRPTALLSSKVPVWASAAKPAAASDWPDWPAMMTSTSELWPLTPGVVWPRAMTTGARRNTPVVPVLTDAKGAGSGLPLSRGRTCCPVLAAWSWQPKAKAAACVKPEPALRSERSSVDCT